MTARALARMPEGVFAATVRQLRAELAAMRGRYDAAVGDLRGARRAIGTTNDASSPLPMRYTDALIALGRGDLGAARERGRDCADAGTDVGRTLRLAAAVGRHARDGR